METVYKVVCSHQRKYFSSLKSYELEKIYKPSGFNLCLRYFTNKFIKPEFGKIFAFDNYNAALDYYNLELYKLAKHNVIAECLTSDMKYPRKSISTAYNGTYYDLME